MSAQERQIAAGYAFGLQQAMQWASDHSEARFWMGFMVALAKWAGAADDKRLTDDMNKVRAEIARHSQGVRESWTTTEKTMR